MSPGKWGGLYEQVIGIYSYMLKKYGILPSMVDGESVADFIAALQEESLYMSIDNVGGW